MSIVINKDKAAALIAARKRAEILAKLVENDAKTVRPLRDVLAATANAMTPDPADLARLEALRLEAATLRSQLV